MCEAFVLLDLLGHGSAEVDVCGDDSRGFAVTLPLFLCDLEILLILVSPFYFLSLFYAGGLGS
jgi:hypothetical protein